MLIYKKIKKNDNIKVIAGKDIGKSGKVLEVDRVKGRIVVQGVNMVKKTKKKTKKDQTGGIKEIESFLNISNIKLICPKCKKDTRVGFLISQDGKKNRICKKCKSVID